MIEATYTGPERIEFDGEAYTGPNAEGDCARALIGAGIDPAELGAVPMLIRSSGGGGRTPRANTPISCCSGTRRGWAGALEVLGHRTPRRRPLASRTGCGAPSFSTSATAWSRSRQRLEQFLRPISTANAGGDRARAAHGFP
jgi:hypothetical protein